MFTLKFLVHWHEGSYCAEVEPEVFSRGAISLSVFFTLKFLVHRRWGRQATALCGAQRRV